MTLFHKISLVIIWTLLLYFAYYVLIQSSGTFGLSGYLSFLGEGVQKSFFGLVLLSVSLWIISKKNKDTSK